MKWNTHEVLDTVVFAVASATPFGFAAAAYTATESLAAPIVLLFIAWCGYVAGRRKSLADWQKRLDLRIIRTIELELMVHPNPRAQKLLDDIREGRQ